MSSTQQCQFSGFNGQRPVHCEDAVAASGQAFCPLHDPSPEKDIAAFRVALEERLASAIRTPDFSYELGGVIFPEPFDYFKGKLIRGPVNLSQAVFLDSCDFSDCGLRDGISAYQTRFGGAVNFTKALLSGMPLFAEAEFAQAAIFEDCNFTEGASFDRARFADLAMWRRARFNGAVRFDEAMFADDADFTAATIIGSFWMTRTKLPPRDSGAVVYFRHVILDSEASVTLNGVDLARVSFNGTLLAQFKFIGCDWARVVAPLIDFHGFGIGRARNGLFDEIAADTSARYLYTRPTNAELDDLYRQLRLNLESTRQEIEASDFYVGQMEMRRRGTAYPWAFRFFGLGGYNALAAYGESWIRPILYYLGVGAAFGLAYLIAGFGGVDGKMIQYRWDDDLFLSQQFWKDFAQAFAHALAAGGLLQQSLSFESWWAPLVRFGNAIWDLLVLGLIVVALRRKFHK